MLAIYQTLFNLLTDIEDTSSHSYWLTHYDLLRNSSHAIMLALSCSVKQEISGLFKRGQHYGRIFHFINTVSSKTNYSALTAHYFRQKVNMTRIYIDAMFPHCLCNLVYYTLLCSFNPKTFFNLCNMIRKRLIRVYSLRIKYLF